jgi:hypothetical protein
LAANTRRRDCRSPSDFVTYNFAILVCNLQIALAIRVGQIFLCHGSINVATLWRLQF